jgi:cell division protease FtsH
MADEEKFTDKLKTPQWRAAIASLLIFLFLILWIQYFPATEQTQFDISYTRFIQELDAGNIKAVTISNLAVSGDFKNAVEISMPAEGKIVTVKKFRTFLPAFQGEDLLVRLGEKKVVITVAPPQEKSFLWQLVLGILPWVLIIAFWIFISRRAQQQIQGGPGGVFTFGASKAKLFDVKKPKITFRDVAGMDKVKNELRETIEYLKEPSLYSKIGAKVPKGVLLVGPPEQENASRARPPVKPACRFSASAPRVYRDVRQSQGLAGQRYVQKAKEAHRA